MHVECPPLILSIIGGEADNPLRDPMVALTEWVRKMLDPSTPTMAAHGDGLTTWEVAVADLKTRRPRTIPEWEQWRMPPPMSSDRYMIYGNVPTDILLAYIDSHGGDSAPLRQRLLEVDRSTNDADDSD